jgi:hypothetical protein
MARYRAWAQRCCTRCQCSVIPAVLFIGFLLVLAIAVHSPGVREAGLAAGLSLAGLVALALAAAVAVHVARSRRLAGPVRPRRQPGVRVVTGHTPAGHRVYADLTAGCACGDPADGEIDGRPACSQCLADAAAAGQRSAEADGQPAGPCGSCGGRPAVTDRAGWPLCRLCAGRVDAAARYAHEVAESVLADKRDYKLTQPPVLPPGETAGQVDMTDFEKRLLS